MPSTPTLAYIAGMGRCGSTLLSFLLDSHPEMVSVGEMHAPPFPRDRPDERMCSCGARAKDCTFFTAVAERMAADGIAFDPRTWDLRYRVQDRQLLSRVAFGSLRSTWLEQTRDALMALIPSYRRARLSLDRGNDRFIRHALELKQARVFVDADKDPIRIRFLSRLDAFRLRVIHLVRDPRGFANSMIRDTGRSAGSAARTWRRVNQNVERHLATLPGGSHLRLNYETVCADPGRTLRELAGFIGASTIDTSDRVAESVHHITGNKMAFDFSGTIKLDEKWKRNLTADDLRDVAREAGAMARRYGYDL